MKEKWRKLKFVHVFKYLIWNTALTCLFLHIEYSYLVRIIVTLCIMSLITFIIAAKLFLGLIYTFFYKSQVSAVNMLTSNSPRYNSPITERLVSQLSDEADKLKSNITTLTSTQWMIPFSIFAIIIKSYSKTELYLFTYQLAFIHLNFNGLEMALN